MRLTLASLSLAAVAALAACGGHGGGGAGGGAGGANPLLGHWKLSGTTPGGSCAYTELDFQPTQQVLTTADGQTSPGRIIEYVYVPGGQTVSFLMTGGTVEYHLQGPDDIIDDSPYPCHYHRA